MRIEIDLAVLGIASQLWTSIAGLVHPALKLALFTPGTIFSTPLRQEPILQEEFDDAQVGSLENVGQGSLPLCLVHAESAGTNILTISSVGHILPSLCLQGCRPLEDGAPFPSLRVGERVEDLLRHSTAWAKEAFQRRCCSQTADT